MGVDASHAHDPGTRRAASAAGPALGAPAAQQDAVTLEFPFGQGVDPGVDRLMRHPASLGLGQHPALAAHLVLLGDDVADGLHQDQLLQQLGSRDPGVTTQATPPENTCLTCYGAAVVQRDLNPRRA